MLHSEGESFGHLINSIPQQQECFIVLYLLFMSLYWETQKFTLEFYPSLILASIFFTFHLLFTLLFFFFFLENSWICFFFCGGAGSKVALLCCVRCCCPAKGITCMCMCILSLWNIPPYPMPPRQDVYCHLILWYSDSIFQDSLVFLEIFITYKYPLAFPLSLYFFIPTFTSLWFHLVTVDFFFQLNKNS